MLKRSETKLLALPEVASDQAMVAGALDPAAMIISEGSAPTTASTHQTAVAARPSAAALVHRAVFVASEAPTSSPMDIDPASLSNDCFHESALINGGCLSSGSNPWDRNPQPATQDLVILATPSVSSGSGGSGDNHTNRARRAGDDMASMYPQDKQAEVTSAGQQANANGAHGQEAFMDRLCRAHTQSFCADAAEGRGVHHQQRHKQELLDMEMRDMLDVGEALAEQLHEQVSNIATVASAVASAAAAVASA